MRRVIAILIIGIILGLIGTTAMAQAANAAADTTINTVQTETAVGTPITASEIAKAGRPVSNTPTHVTVGSQSMVSGQFFTDMWGNNTSDMDVRTLLYGYNTVVWASQVQFTIDPMVVADVKTATANRSVVYTITLQQDLTYNDGKTPITAKDYVFSLLLCASPEMAQLGAKSTRLEGLVGYEAYHLGKTKALAGVRLLDDYTFSIAVSADHEPFFYDLANIRCVPYPRSVLAPNCDVTDTAKGAALCNQNPNQTTVPFTVEVLQRTVMDAQTGYRSHPMLTCGPYSLEAYDSATGRVDFVLNPYYKGNYEGVKPVIDTLTLLPARSDTMMQKLSDGTFDLLNKCVDADVIEAGIAANDQGIVGQTYARMGYGYCAFMCEKGPQQFVAVRQAIAYSVDKDAILATFLKGFGLPVYGYYGMGQWMTLAAMGTLRPDGITAKDGRQWDQLTIDSLNPYALDVEKAKQLLIMDGWTLNADGKKFVEGTDEVRYKKVGKTLMALSIRFAQTIDNQVAALVAQQLQQNLPKLGFALRVDQVTYAQLLKDYYQTDEARTYDMCVLATNFLSPFDPYYTFAKDPDNSIATNLSGLYDQKLSQLAWKMHKTQPMDYLTYEKNWLAFQRRFNEILPTLPLYSNVYFDFHTDWLQNYQPNTYAGWAEAIQYAYFAEPQDAAAADVPTVTASPQNAPSAEDDIVILE